MAPAIPVLLLALAAAPPAPGTGAPPERSVRCEGQAAPRLGEEASNVTVTRIRTEAAARAAAVRACVAAIAALPLGGGTVADRSARDPRLAREIEAVVRATRPADAPRLYADGGVRLALVVPLDGPLSRLLLGADTWTEPVPARAR